MSQYDRSGLTLKIPVSKPTTMSLDILTVFTLQSSLLGFDAV